MNQKKTLAAVAGFLLDDCPASFLCRLRSEAAGHSSSHGLRECAYSKHLKELELVDAV